ncbi:MAG TPA: NADH-quinone oxidoreductase subunit L [Gammaproteobacteria bacterium]|nr:NADH-quinone oxidoreductase subunit L [Gammaproteobacteria bacterium]
MEKIYLAIVLAPLIASAIAGLFGRGIGRAGAHWVTILGVAVSFVLSLFVFKHLVFDGGEAFNGAVYRWASMGSFSFEVGFLVDRLTVLMMCVVTFVSLCVHVYTIGYMHDDDGYQRFFSYISLFTFSMLMLVMSNNFMQLFFGWEAVGVVSYLLIGFWYKRPTAIFANLKAFLVNRVGDFGFLLGIAALASATGTLDYALTFGDAQRLSHETIEIVGGHPWSLLTFSCICLFVGAMGKSAQMPLHVWLPDSMEGPTPISALIHAATMVTAGIFMVARMSPLFELTQTALGVVITIGAITAFLTGLLGIVQQDIKRVIAYSTLSQLGYMTVALGAGAYAAGIFHLMTHAFFKALLFLAAGSVIIAMHHEQDIRKMGGLRKHLPITYWTSVIGTLALIGFPGFSGFFSKDALIEAVHASTTPGHTLAYWSVLLGVFVTSFYSFRLLFVVFHGKERMDHHTQEHLHETPWVVTGPLIALAIPSIGIGWLTIKSVLFGEYFEGAIFNLEGQNPLHEIEEEFHGPLQFVIDGLMGPAFWLAAAGAALAWFLYLRRPDIPARLLTQFAGVNRVLQNKYYFDWFNENVIARASRGLGGLLWKVGDQTIIDGGMVNGSARLVGIVAVVARGLQSGYLYHYAFAMIVGLAALVGWLVLRS